MSERDEDAARAKRGASKNAADVAVPPSDAGEHGSDRAGAAPASGEPDATEAGSTTQRDPMYRDVPGERLGG